MLRVVSLLVIDDDGYINASKKARGVRKVTKMIDEYVSADSVGPFFPYACCHWKA